MNYKVLSLCLGIALFASIGPFIFNQFFMKSSFQYSDYESLRAADTKSWLPDYIPISSINIKEEQNHDSGYFSATFEYQVKDKSSVQKVCIKVFEEADTTKYVCPSSETRTNILILGTNGQARFTSNPTNI